MSFKQQALNFLIQDLFTGHCFDICKVKAVAKHMGQKENDPKFSLIREFHCISWIDMAPEFVIELQSEALRLLGFTEVMTKGTTENTTIPTDHVVNVLNNPMNPMNPMNNQ